MASIQKKALPAEQFVVPPDYSVLNLEQMLGAMMGMGGMPTGMPAVGSAMPGMAASLPPGVSLPKGMVSPPGVVLPPAALRAIQAAQLQAAKSK